MLAVVMRRVKKALARGAAAPTSWEQFAAIVERSQAEGDKGRAAGRRAVDGRRLPGDAAVSVPQRAQVQELLLAAPDGNRK